MQIVNGSKFWEIKTDLQSTLFYENDRIDYILIRQIDQESFNRKYYGNSALCLIDFDFQKLIEKLNLYVGIERASVVIAKRAKKIGVRNFLIEIPTHYHDYPAILYNYRII